MRCYLNTASCGKTTLEAAFYAGFPRCEPKKATKIRHLSTSVQKNPHKQIVRAFVTWHEVPMDMKSRSYNFLMRLARLKNWWVLLILITSPLCAQQPSNPSSILISTKELPKALLWEPYTFDLDASGGTGPYHWRMVSGSLPHTVQLNEEGELTGKFDEPGSYELHVAVKDSSEPAQQFDRQFALTTETPLTVDWQQKVRTSGQRMDGSVRVSNRSGRDFDLTFIVLAVNEIGRATAIGYQHFSLKRDTKDLELPFGDTLARGSYVVNVDVVGEEPVSNRIFRERLTAEQAVTQGP